MNRKVYRLRIVKVISGNKRMGTIHVIGWWALRLTMFKLALCPNVLDIVLATEFDQDNQQPLPTEATQTKT